MRLSRSQATEALARLSPAAKAIALALARTPEEKESLRTRAVELESKPIGDSQLAGVEERLREAPPVRFDIARQVRVFEPYLQYVDLRLTGAAIQRHRLPIPKTIQNLGGDKSFQSRLKTTFELIERESEVSSEHLDDELNEIRKNFTRSLGKPHGRVLLKAKKSLVEKRLAELEGKLNEFQAEIKEKLDNYLKSSREEIIKYYLPLVMAHPPDALAGQSMGEQPTAADARRWLNAELEKVFPKPEQLIDKMELQKTYKDVTFETLNAENFLPLIKSAFPGVDWEKAYDEFRAVGEAKK
jgi:hypothetical protein